MHGAPSLAVLQSYSYFANTVPLTHPFIYLKRKEAKPLGLCSAADCLRASWNEFSL